MAAAMESPGPAQSEGGEEEALKKLEELLQGLLHFRSLLPRQTSSTSSPPSRTSSPLSRTNDPPSCPQLEEEMEKTLKLMEQIQVSPAGRGRALELRAQALGVCPSGLVRAEETLSHLVKLEPNWGRAWTQLGEIKWKLGDLEGAQDCFRGALNHAEAAEPHRLLSMALRGGLQGGGRGKGGPQQGAESPLLESLRQAEAAVRCDPRDGLNWYVLGNAYVALFFAVGQRPEWAQRALGAYGQALLQFQERFQEALEGLERAQELDPDWPEPRQRHRSLLDFLSRLCALLANGGQARGKRRHWLQRAPPPSLIGPGWPRPSPLLHLQPGANQGHSLLGRVLFSLCPQPGGVPYTVGVADGAGSVAAVMIYNAAPDWSVQVGDTLGVADPLLVPHQHQHQGKTFSFLGVRVSSPLSLLVNGRRPPGPSLSPAQLNLHNEAGPTAP